LKLDVIQMKMLTKEDKPFLYILIFSFCVTLSLVSIIFFLASQNIILRIVLLIIIAITISGSIIIQYKSISYFIKKSS
ncbi:MAG: hypothetical protein ACXAEU_21180, partial [Candidatus Hodarchaeales archaeon]